MEQYRIAFYIELCYLQHRLENADLDIGNPGVGGTQYLFLLNIKYLNRLYGKKCAVLLTDGNFSLNDDDISLVDVGKVEDAISYCKKTGIPTLVINANLIEIINPSALETDVSILLWAHNTLTWKRQCIASKVDSVKKVVCVSEIQYLNMRDTPCAKKCTYINNVIPGFFYHNAHVSDYSERKVIYIGSIMPQKGVHNLIEIWRYVEDKCPDAQLYIFGGANVWNNNAKLGINSAADRYYDKVISRRMKRLKHPQNIHFMGPKGWKEIEPLIVDARAGVVNPSYYLRDETFCMSAIELEAHGLPIVSRDRGDGLKTTVKNNITGYLGRTNRRIADFLISLLNNGDLCKKLGEKAQKHAGNFLVQNEVHKWIDIVDGLNQSGEFQQNRSIISKDGYLLKHDFVLKCLYLLESGKVIDLIKAKIYKKK